MFSGKYDAYLVAKQNHFNVFKIATIRLPTPPIPGWVIQVGDTGYRVEQIYLAESGHFVVEVEKVSLPNVKDLESHVKIPWGSI